MYSRRQGVSYRQLEHWWLEYATVGRVGRLSGGGVKVNSPCSYSRTTHPGARRRGTRSVEGKGGLNYGNDGEQYTCEGIVDGEGE